MHAGMKETNNKKMGFDKFIFYDLIDMSFYNSQYPLIDQSIGWLGGPFVRLPSYQKSKPPNQLTILRTFP